MKTEQSLLKTPADPLAALPEPRLARVGAAPVTVRAPLRAAKAAKVIYGDIPASVYGTFIFAWTALMTVFWFTFAESPNAAFMVAISTAFGIMFFGVPLVMSRMDHQPQPWAGPDLPQFLRGQVQTLTGPVNGFDALVQCLVVPVCLTIGAVAISVIINLDRANVMLQLPHA